MQRRKLNPNKPPTFSVTNLNLPTLRKTLEIPNGLPLFDLPPSYRLPEVGSESDDSEDEEESIARGYRKSTMFGNRFMEHLIDRSLRKGAISEDVWMEVQASFEVLEKEYGIGRV